MYYLTNSDGNVALPMFMTKKDAVKATKDSLIYTTVVKVIVKSKALVSTRVVWEKP